MAETGRILLALAILGIIAVMVYLFVVPFVRP